MNSKLRIIVTGLIAQYPLGGVAWDYLQYVLGLVGLGHDVYYFEDTGQWPYNPKEGGLAKDCKDNVDYLATTMERFALGGKWAYCFPWQKTWFGLSDEKRRRVIQTSDLLINVSGTLARPQDYRQGARLAYIDSDPVFTQVKLERGQADLLKIVNSHDIHFSFGEALMDSPYTTGHNWLPTRQPIVLSQWTVRPPARDVYTTVMNWTSFNPVIHNGKSYGQKDEEFRKFIQLPKRVHPVALEIAINSGKTSRTPKDLLRHHGWRVEDPDQACPTLDSYRTYIESSKAEWSVAKNGYVVGQSGWFSCRSACYLAAGKPVIVQDTGFSSILPTGEGLLPFNTMEEAIAAIQAVESGYARHAQAAREIAEHYFDSAKVLDHLIQRAMSS